MLLTEIAANVNIQTNNQLSPEQVVLVLDGAQKAAFNKNLRAFLVYDKRLTVLTVLRFESGAYYPAQDAEIGLPVVGDVEGAATLAGYNNDLREWYVTGVTEDFVASEGVIVSGGTAAGSLLSSDFQAVHKGPYTAPTKDDYPRAPCRKIWGVTTREPGRFNLNLPECIPSDYNYRQHWPANGRPFETGETNDFEKTFLFAFDPSLETTYYWVYWRGAPDIDDLSDSTTLVIPEEYHFHFQQLCMAMAESIVAKQPFSQPLVEAFMGDWWSTLIAPYRNQKGFQNMTQNPNQGRGSLL